ncbi:hypothetical protein ACO1O0_000483 [Amphichorda felina]
MSLLVQKDHDIALPQHNNNNNNYYYYYYYNNTTIIVMCTYSRTIYNCNHVIWGRRVKVCTIAEDFQQGILPQDCAFRKPHGLKSTKLARRCDKCVRLDERLLVARRKLKESQEEFGKRWIEPRRKSEEEGGSDGLKEEREYVGGGEEGWIYSEDGEIRTSKGGDVSHAAESIQEEISSSSILEEGSQLREGSVSRAHTRSSLEESQSTDFTSDAGSFLSIDDSEYSLTGDSNASPSASSTTSPSSSEAAETSHTTPGNTPRMLETTAPYLLRSNKSTK